MLVCFFVSVYIVPVFHWLYVCERPSHKRIKIKTCLLHIILKNRLYVTWNENIEISLNDEKPVWKKKLYKKRRAGTDRQNYQFTGSQSYVN